MSEKSTIGFEEINQKLDRVIDAMATKDDIARLDARIDSLEQKFDRRFEQVLASIDGLVKVVTDLQREYAAVSAQLSRHEEWIKLIAKKSGVKLPL